MTALPAKDCDVTVLGPECFIDAEEMVISYKGANYARVEAPATDLDTIARSIFIEATTRTHGYGRAFAAALWDSNTDPAIRNLWHSVAEHARRVGQVNSMSYPVVVGFRDRVVEYHGPVPTVVCLCGSTRFSEAFQQANLEHTVAGEIVLSIGCDMRSDNSLWSDPVEAASLKDRLDELHKRKIDLADYVMVLNVGGYIGESTRSEIAYATSLGKLVVYLEQTTEPELLPDQP